MNNERETEYFVLGVLPLPYQKRDEYFSILCQFTLVVLFRLYQVGDALQGFCSFMRHRKIADPGRVQPGLK